MVGRTGWCWPNPAEAALEGVVRLRGRDEGGIRAYRQAIQRAFDPDNRFARLSWWIAKYHAFVLRGWVGAYRDRAGYDPSWQRRYRRPAP